MSLKTDLQETQPIFYQILLHCFQSKKIPHAFLITGDNASLAAHYIAKSLVCENDVLACNECHECHRIDEYNYGDFIYVNGKKDKIKKSHIEYIQEQFAKTSLEGKAKIYLLENIENSTIDAMNSLLKILEEPTADTYAIFTSQNINRVLSTIQSRCQMIQLLPSSKTSLIKQLSQADISQEDVHILSELFSSYEQCVDYFNNETFDNLKLDVYHFIDDLYFHQSNLLINVQTHLLKDYNSKENIQLFLNMLVLALLDLFHVKQNEKLIFSSQQSLLEKIEDSYEGIIKKIEIALNTEYLLTTNANIDLLMDSMMYRMQKG